MAWISPWSRNGRDASQTHAESVSPQSQNSFGVMVWWWMNYRYHTCSLLFSTSLCSSESPHGTPLPRPFIMRDGGGANSCEGGMLWRSLLINRWGLKAGTPIAGLLHFDDTGASGMQVQHLVWDVFAGLKGGSMETGESNGDERALQWPHWHLQKHVEKEHSFFSSANEFRKLKTKP